MSQQHPNLVVTAVRNEAGKFINWTMSGGSNCAKPPDCAVPVAHGNNAVFTISINDPNRPSTEPQITFQNLLVPPTPKVEIKIISGLGSSPLVFTDHNQDQETLKYWLVFNNAPPIDPIIQNGGGGSPPSALGFIPLPTTTQQFTIDLLIAFVIGAIVAVLARRLFSR
jgi:hypothetical protein